MVKRERDDSESSSITSSSPTTIDPKLLAAQPASTPDTESAKGSPAKKARGKRGPNLKSTQKTLLPSPATRTNVSLHAASRCFLRFPEKETSSEIVNINAD